MRTARWLRRMVIPVAALYLVMTAALPALAGPTTILIAGDIAQGSTGSQESATANLVAGRSGLVMTAGDNAYPDGTYAEFLAHYDPTWGRFRKRTRPTPGNHDYQTARAAGYFRYFGWRAGPRLPNGNGRGYYAFSAGSWLVLALDSEACYRSQGCRRGSPEYRWLAQKLASSEKRCAMAVWHRPPFSSGYHGDQSNVRPLLRVLYRHGVEILVNGHDHDYERMAPARPDGEIDAGFGVRQFVVGTGGADLRPQGPDVVPHSRVFQSTDHGVLRLKLRKDGYDWTFLPIEGRTFEDRGSGRCHGKPR